MLEDCNPKAEGLSLKSISDMQTLLLTAYYTEGPIEGRKRLQKIVYILKELRNIKFSYEFVPYLYGPYCSRLQDDMNLLARLGFLKAFKVDDIYVYEITSKGKETAEEIQKDYGAENCKHLRRYVQWMKDFSTDELVKWSKDLMEKKLGPDIWI